MILRSVWLQGCRCFHNPIELGPFSDGINLIAGPNESGKSTIIEAVARALFDRHKTTDRAVRALQPWGTNLAPEIVLEFECDGERYQLEKRFLVNPRAELKVLGRTGFRRQWQGDEADKFVREIMLGSLPGSGGTKPLHWGIAQFLWSIQRVEREPGPVGGLVADRLREACGGVAAAPTRQVLTQRVEEETGKYWTPTGRVASASPLHYTLQELSQLETKLQEVEAKYREAMDYEERLSSWEGEIRRNQAQTEEKERRRQELEEAAAAVRELRDEIARLEKDLGLARKEEERLARQVETYRAAQRECSRAREEVEAQRQVFQQAQIAVGTAKQLEAVAQREYEEANARVHQRTQELERARNIRQAQQLAAEEKRLSQQAERLEELEGHMRDLQRQYDQGVWPDGTDVQRARRLERDREVLRAKLQAVGVRVRVELLSEQNVTFEGGDTPETHRAGAGETFDYLAGEEAVVTLEGVAQIRARSGAEEPAQVAGELRRAEAELVELLGQFRAASVDELEKLREQGERLHSELEQIGKQIKAEAEGHQTAARVRALQAEVRRKLGGLLAQLGIAERDLSAHAAADEAGLVRQVEEAGAEAKRKYDEWQARTREREAAEDQEAACHADLDAATATVREQESVMATVLRTEGSSSIERLHERLRAAESRRAELEQQVEALRGRLPHEVEDPARQLETVRAALQELESERSRLEEERVRCLTLLEEAQKARVFEGRAQVKDALDRARAQVRRQLCEGLAARLVERLYQDRRRGLAAPLEGLQKKFDRIFRAVCGRDRPAMVDPDHFRLVSLRPGPELEPQSIEEFSSGTQEQADLCWRLALGEVYAEKFGRQVMVLDDRLVYTDDERHARMLEVLKIAGQSLQIFLLTSHPHYYSGLSEARFDVVELASRAGR